MTRLRLVAAIALGAGVAVSSACGSKPLPPTGEDGSGNAAGRNAPRDGGTRARVGRVYVGSSEGRIWVFAFDENSQSLTPVGSIPAGRTPSYLAVDPSRRFLYAVDEAAAQINVFAIEPGTGLLSPLQTVNSAGDGPTFVTVDRTGRSVLVANARAGNVALFPIQPDGRLGPVSVTRTFGAEARTQAIVPDPSNTIVAVPNGGLGSVAVLRLGASSFGDLTTVTSGEGVRRVAFAPGGGRAYVLDGTANTVNAFIVDAPSGNFIPIGTVSTLPEGYVGDNTAGEIAVVPTGRQVIVSNRGNDGLVVYNVNVGDGSLDPILRVSTGGSPRYFQIDETGRFLLVGNQGTNAVAVMRIDGNGIPMPLGAQTPVPAPEFVSLVYIDAAEEEDAGPAAPGEPEPPDAGPSDVPDAEAPDAEP